MSLLNISSTACCLAKLHHFLGPADLETSSLGVPRWCSQNLVYCSGEDCGPYRAGTAELGLLPSNENCLVGLGTIRVGNTSTSVTSDVRQ